MNRHLKLLVCLCGAAAFAADGENAAPADELAARRLQAAIPHLGMCILGDGLYACAPLMELCEKHGWDYIFTF